jgi:pimeloyl-ACP methyl ester carboxylesterase
MVKCMADLGSRSYWRQWRSIQCPTLVVFGEHGVYPADHAQQLVDQLPGSEQCTIPGAGHDVHLDAPHPWVHALADSTAR